MVKPMKQGIKNFFYLCPQEFLFCCIEMKKAIFLVLAFMCCVPAFSQESSDEKSMVPEVSVIARLDANPVIPFSDEAKVPFDPADFFGSTALYTIFEGRLSGHFAYSLGFNWLSADPRSIYMVDYEDGTSKPNLFYSDRPNWRGWAFVSFTAGGFELRVGKDFLALGNLESDDIDYDVFPDACSYFWHNYNIFQWGATASYTLPDEANTFALQFQTSPFGEKAFSSKLFTYSLQWRGEYDWGTFLYSTNFLEYAPKSFLNIIGLGQEFYLGDFAVRLDYMNRAASLKNFFSQEQAAKLELKYEFGEKFDLGAWATGDFIMGEKAFLTEEEDLGTLWSTGLIARWYPFDGLRVHCVAGYNQYLHEDGLSVNLGVTYKLKLNGLFSRKKAQDTSF